MKKTGLYILKAISIIFLTVEFLWSVLVAVVEAIGTKLNELTDAIQSVTEKMKA